MSNSSTPGGILLVVLLVVLGAYSFLKTQAKNQTVIAPTIVDVTALIESEKTGLKYSLTMSNIRKDLQKLQDDGNLVLIIKAGKLTNPILGQTSIIISDESKVEATITIDATDAVAAGDSVEPLLGHEFKHVWDALFLYDKTSPYVSATKFIETANKQKNNTLYHSREVEASAIATEDIIRKELIRSDNKSFVTLPASRQAADIKYIQKMKFNLHLK